MKSPSPNWLCWCTLALLPLVWLWPSVFGGRTFVPFDPAQFPPVSLSLSAEQLAEARADANFDVTEVWPWLLPEMELAQREVAQGRLPSWDPHARTGAPLHEVGVLGVFYPPHWLWLIGGDPKGWLVYLTWISLALAGGFTFGLLRAMALSPLAAWFGAASFELAGAMATNGFFWTRLPALCWLPALLWALHGLAAGDRLRPWPLAAVALTVALPWLAGFPPYATAGTLLGGLFAVRLVLERLGRDGARAGRQLLLRLGLGLLLGVLLTMPQVLPSSWFYAFEGARSASPGFEMLRSTRFDTYGLLGYLMPDAFGHPVSGHDLPYRQSPLPYLWCDRFDAAGKAIEPNYNYTEYSVFFGTLGVLLAGFGLVRGRGHRRWFVVAVLALLFGLALFVPGVRLLYYLPAIKNVFAMRWLAPATLLLAWLAAIGFERLALVERRSLLRLTACTLALAAAVLYLTRQPAAWHAADRQWPASAIAERFGVELPGVVELFCGNPPAVDRFAIATERFAAAGSEAGLWLLLCGALLCAYALVQDRRARTWILRALPLVTVVQLGLHGRALLPGQRLEHGTDTEVHAFLRRQAEASAASGGFTIARGSPLVGDALPPPLALPPGQLMVPGIRDLNFYSHGDRRTIEPLRKLLPASRIADGHSYLAKVLPDGALEHPLFDLLGVRYVLSTAPLQHAGARVGPQLRGEHGEFFVHERPHALPRAFTVPTLRRCESDAAVLEAMVDPGVRFDRAALVSGDAPDSPAPAGGNRREVRFTRDEPAVVELDIAAGGHEWLVVTDTWFPGWTATIDGEPAVIRRCNHSMRLLQLPNAACRVRFAYAAPLLPYGITLALAALAGLGIVFVIRRRSSSVMPVDETAE